MVKRRTLLDDEPGVVAGLHQTLRLLKRAYKRPLATVAFSLACSALLVGGLALKDWQFAPRVVLRAVEMDRDPAQAPRLKRHLREYVRGAVFTSAALYALIEKHGISPSLYRKNPRAALESFREDIDLDVYQNYFIEERSQHQAPRSARVAIRYRSSNRDLALGVTRDLAILLVEHEARVREQQSRRAAAAARHALEVAERQLASRRVAVSSARQRVEIDADPHAEVEFVGLMASLPVLEARVSEAARLKAAFDLGAAFEQKGMGLRFEEVDEGGIPASEGLDGHEYLLLGVSFFVLGLPLVALGVGAFTRQADRPNERGAS